MMEINEILEHFPDDLSQDIQQFSTDHVFRWSRYLFTRREGKRQYAYCTHCKTDTSNTSLKHNTDAKCPNCGSTCTVKASGIGRSRLIDEGYFVFYEKSTYDPEAIVARGIYAVRDYRGDYRKVETHYLVKAYYLFRPGQTYMLKRWGYYSTWNGKNEISFGKIERCKSVYSLFAPTLSNGWGGAKNIMIGYSRDSIKKAVRRTPFRYSTWEKYDHEDMVKFFALYAKYPCVEYLTKVGFDYLIQTKLQGDNTCGCINWRGKSLMSVLRLSKKDLKELNAAKTDVSPSFLRLLQISRHDGSNLSFDDIRKIDKAVGYYLSDFQKVLKHTTLRKAFAYIHKQLPIMNDRDVRAFYAEWEVVRTWRDYLRDCMLLELDLMNERTVYPRNLYRAHQNTIKQAKYKADELLKRKVAARMAALQKYCFEANDLLIRPAASTEELIAEGKALEHCVGGYAQSYATGRTIIMLIRKREQPDKPFFTMEIYKNKITQVRGARNCDPDQALKRFVEDFEAARLKTQEVKARVTVPA